MPETGSGEIKMPRNPEQSPAGPEKPVEPTFEQRVLALIDPPIRSKVRVADEQLVSLVRGALGEKGQDVKEVSRFLESGDELIIEGKAPEVEWKKVKPLLEQKRASLEVVQPDAVRKTTRTKLDRRLKGLITPRKTKSKPEVVDQRLVDLARSALEPEATQASKLAEILTKGRELYQDGMVKPEEWRKLAPVLEQRQAELRATVQPEPSEPRPARPTARRQMSSPSVGGISPEAQRIAEDLDRVQAEIRDLGGRGELNSEDVKKFAELLKASQGIYGGAAMPGLESQRPTIPSVERIGPEEYRAEFHKRLTELIEQNVDQSFDANWRLVYPLETAISSLRPEHGQADTFEYGGQEHSYSDLRRELAIKLSAFRACHNHAYLHTRVGGVDSLIDASHLLRLDSIEYLLGQKDIARGFAKFEELGRQYREADETMNNKVKDSLMIEMKAMAKGEGDWGWRGIMAGNLYSSLGEAARRDVNLDRAGDFFMARLFNSAKRAEGDWKGKWDREPYDEICQAADLKVAPFFMMVLTDIKKKLRSTDKKTYKSEFDKFCSHAGIKGVKIEEETDKVVGASFERANMAALLFGEGDGWKIALPANVFTMAQLDIADAENVRKLIFNPDGLLQKPNLGILDRKINAVFKHLKGEERAKWFEDMVVAVVNYYLDRSFPAFEGLPSQLRSSISKRDFPDVNPWAWQLAKAQIEAMSPALNRENVFSAFRRTIGPGWRAKIYGRKTLEVVGGGAVDTIKAIFKEMLGLK